MVYAQDKTKEEEPISEPQAFLDQIQANSASNWKWQMQPEQNALFLPMAKKQKMIFLSIKFFQQGNKDV